MTRDELEKRNVGENLDALMNLDPRGYGVCRILYAGSRAYTGEPLTMHAAQVLCDTVKENDLVYIITGFVLLPHKVPEMDGTVSAMLLARALVMAFGAKPVIVCPDDSVQAIEKCAAVVGLHIYEDLDTVQALPLSMGVVAFTKDIAAAPAQATELAARKPFYFFLDVVFFIRFRRNAADDQIEVFSLNDLGCLFLHLLSGKVDQKIAHAEYWITRLVSDTHFDHGAVLFRNDAVQSQRQCHPLVLKAS